MDVAVRNCRQVLTFPARFERVMGAVYLGVKGDVTLVMEGGNIATLTNLEPGMWHHMRFTGIAMVKPGKAADQTFVGCCL